MRFELCSVVALVCLHMLSFSGELEGNGVQTVDAWLSLFECLFFCVFFHSSVCPGPGPGLPACLSLSCYGFTPHLQRIREPCT